MQLQRTWYFGIMILAVVVFGWQVGMIYGQDDEPEYAGIRECRACHRSYANDLEDAVHYQTLIEVEEAENPEDVILADFEAGEELRTIEFPDGETRAFTEKDVFYTLGAGRHYQAYVLEVDDGVFRVLPAQWNTIDEAWVELPLADDWSDPAYDFNSQCAGCHTTNYNAEKLEWDEAGVQCEACHGPGLNHVEIADDAGSSLSDDEYAELSGAINFALDAQVCGQCHNRGSTPDDAHHFPVGYLPGDNLLDETIYLLPELSNPDFYHSTGHAKLPNMQFNEWLESSHVSALETAQGSEEFTADCLTCHSVAQRRIDYLIDEDFVDEDEFDKLSVLDRHSFGVTCTACHNPHEVDNEKLLIEEDRYDLCTDCHTNDDNREGIHHPVKEMFEGDDFLDDIDGVDGVHYSVDEGPTCVTCHMSNVMTKSGNRPTHTFAPIVPTDNDDDTLDGTCAACHDTLTNTDMQFLITGIQDSVRNRLVASSARLATYDQPDPDSDTYDTYMTISNALAFVQGDGSMGIHNYAYTDSLLTLANEQLSALNVPDIEPEPTEGPAPTATPAVETTITEFPEERRVPSGVRPMTRIILGGVFLLLAIAAFVFYRSSRSSETEV